MSGEKQPCQSNGQQKLKILCLHGYRQSGESLRQKTGSFRKLAHKYAEFTYVTAPHRVLHVREISDEEEKEIVEQLPEEEQFGWFFNRDDRTFRGIRKGGPAVGFESSVKFVEECFETLGPFDGILGFSQGACLVGLLCSLQHRKLLKASFNFAVIVSGFKSNCLPHLKYYFVPIELPTMHVFGENDKIIPTDMSNSLVAAFSENAVTVMHPGGHYLPAGAAQKHIYQKFFRSMLEMKQNTVPS